MFPKSLSKLTQSLPFYSPRSPSRPLQPPPLSLAPSGVDPATPLGGMNKGADSFASAPSSPIGARKKRSRSRMLSSVEPNSRVGKRVAFGSRRGLVVYRSPDLTKTRNIEVSFDEPGVGGNGEGGGTDFFRAGELELLHEEDAF